ncbi:MAG: hypothetical protein QOG87_2797 [Actinomycetota bacterium]
MRTYGQYCPIARTSELMAERWTPIIVRNLLAGCRTFGQLADGAPGISRALLADRLETLERHDIVQKLPSDDRRTRWTYELTERGRQLKAITDAMGEWGARWLELEPHHTDAAYTLWATTKLVDLEELDDSGLTVRVRLKGVRSTYWLMLRKPYPEVCTTSQGREEDLVIDTDSTTLARVHLRRITPNDAVREGLLSISGPARVRRSLLAALRPSPYAHVTPAAGRPQLNAE